jgi:CTP synthase (UTP-ammonia lyase)
MTATIQVGLVGDYDADVPAHQAIPPALRLAAGVTGAVVEPVWLATPAIEADPAQLSGYDALWCVPNSPYASMGGALHAIRFAREHGVPFLGTCGGFQHAVIEYARDVIGLADADHAESNPEATLPIMVPLTCSLVGAEGTITLVEGSRARAIYGRDRTVERYHCSFGLNPRYRSLFEGGQLRISGVDSADGEVRVVELGGHPFFVATLFQPERSAFENRVHPLIAAYVQAAINVKSAQTPARV